VLRLSLFREDVIAARLAHILALENVRPAVGVVEGLARLAHGSMRDALSITDQLLALVGDAPSAEDVERLAGASASNHVAELIEALLLHDGARALELLGPAEGAETEWVAAILRDLRGALLLAVCKGDSTLVGDFAADRERLERIAATLGPVRLQSWMEDLLGARERMENVPTLARTVLELTLLELCRDESSLPLAELVQRLAALEQRLGAGGANTKAAAPAPSPRPQVLRPVPPPAPYSPAAPRAPVQAAPAPALERSPAAPAKPQAAAALRNPRASQGLQPAWKGFLARLASEDAELSALLERRGALIDLNSERAHVQLKLLRSDERQTLADPELRARCERAFQAACGSPVTPSPVPPSPVPINAKISAAAAISRMVKLDGDSSARVTPTSVAVWLFDGTENTTLPSTSLTSI
jgi:DNA polymerase III gamma/tau subunit